MTGRTHDLGAFTSLVLLGAGSPIPQISLATALVALAGNLIGGIAPDLDEPTSYLWNKIPAGSIFGRIVHPLLGGHRMISHSLLGLWGFGLFAKFLLGKIGTVLLVDMNIVWWAFMIGYLSHLVMDTVTKDGVPWLFPIPIRIGFPPFKFLRITTGAFTEKAVVFPGLLILNGYLIYQNYGKFFQFLTHFLK